MFQYGTECHCVEDVGQGGCRWSLKWGVNWEVEGAEVHFTVCLSEILASHERKRVKGWLVKGISGWRGFLFSLFLRWKRLNMFTSWGEESLKVERGWRKGKRRGLWRQEGTGEVDGPGGRGTAGEGSRLPELTLDEWRAHWWKVAPVHGVRMEESCARVLKGADRSPGIAWRTAGRGQLRLKTTSMWGDLSPPFSTTSPLGVWVVEAYHLRMGYWGDHPSLPGTEEFPGTWDFQWSNWKVLAHQGVAELAVRGQKGKKELRCWPEEGL